MIGVVIWSCARSERVILWCDDNGPLAYARGAQAFVAAGAEFPGVGDFVAFEVATESPRHDDTPPIRHASAVRVVERMRFPGVDQLLKEAARRPEAALRPAPARAEGKVGRAAPHPHLRLAAAG